MVVNDGIIHLLCSVFGTCLMNGMMVYPYPRELHGAEATPMFVGQ